MLNRINIKGRTINPKKKLLLRVFLYETIWSVKNKDNSVIEKNKKYPSNIKDSKSMFFLSIKRSNIIIKTWNNPIKETKNNQKLALQ